MNSLCQGVRDSFNVPRSRALGGKSGITRAEPLVLLSYLSPSRPLLVAVVLLLLYLAFTSSRVSSQRPPEDFRLLTGIDDAAACARDGAAGYRAPRARQPPRGRPCNTSDSQFPKQQLLVIDGETQ